MTDRVRLVAGLAAIAALAILSLYRMPILDAGWNRLRPALPAPIDPAAPRDPDRANRDDALACLARLCPEGRPDLGAPILPLEPVDLRRVVAALAAVYMRRREFGASRKPVGAAPTIVPPAPCGRRFGPAGQERRSP